ncbi:hypothetical protein QTH87_01440 [Variovorax sp. J22P168]|uniref:hypothetical protein n=1 Tax=Variovorax jilinensis TaxID=3053513 RepID=UPI002574B70F|nr:hypothetical protein [Variovorax sp. J22P168]MDM0011089.1 hypothetical protein [Variovorax sp. J22P168]
MGAPIVFDPVCGSARGHNYKTAIKYAEWMIENGQGQPEIWIPESDCDPAETTIPVKKNLPWVYEYFLPTQSRAPHPWLQRFVRRIKHVAPTSKLVRIALSPFFLLFHLVSLRGIRGSLGKALKSEPSLLFMPGADLFSILALHELAKKGLIKPDQLIVVRLMGVMETAGYLPGSHEMYLTALQLLTAHRLRILISGETEKYATFLERQLKINVPVTHIPIHEAKTTVVPASPNSSPTTRNVVCLGGARADKGYFELFEHAQRCRLTWGRSMHFYVQRMSPQNPEYNLTYELALARSINVTLLPAYLEDDVLFSWIARSDAVYLPYSTGTYAQRGSAILFDSLPFGKLIVGRRGTGFGDSIDSFGLGVTFHDWHSLDRAFETVMQQNDVSRERLKARQLRYLDTLTNNLGDVTNGKNIVRIY